MAFLFSDKLGMPVDGESGEQSEPDENLAILVSEDLWSKHEEPKRPASGLVGAALQETGGIDISGQPRIPKFLDSDDSSYETDIDSAHEAESEDIKAGEKKEKETLCSFCVSQDTMVTELHEIISAMQQTIDAQTIQIRQHKEHVMHLECENERLVKENKGLKHLLSESEWSAMRMTHEHSHEVRKRQTLIENALRNGVNSSAMERHDCVDWTEVYRDEESKLCVEIGTHESGQLVVMRIVDSMKGCEWSAAIPDGFFEKLYIPGALSFHRRIKKLTRMMKTGDISIRNGPNDGKMVRITHSDCDLSAVLKSTLLLPRVHFDEHDQLDRLKKKVDRLLDKVEEQDLIIESQTEIISKLNGQVLPSDALKIMGEVSLKQMIKDDCPDKLDALAKHYRWDVNDERDWEGNPVYLAKLAQCNITPDLNPLEILHAKWLFIHRSGVTERDTYKEKSALELCSLSKKLYSMLEWFLKEGSIDPMDGQSGALFAAAWSGNDLAARILLADPRVSINRPNILGMTPLMKAAENGHTAVLSLLLKHGCDTDRSNSEGLTALDIALQNGQHEIAAYLESMGAPRGRFA